MSTTPSDSVEGLESAVRLIVEYDGDRLSLVSQQRVAMAVQALDVAHREGLMPGNYAEVRDADGVTVADVRIRDALSTSVEVFPEDPDAPITRTDVQHPSGSFTVVVPVGPAAKEVAIVRIPPVVPSPGASGMTAESQAREELATFSLESES